MVKHGKPTGKRNMKSLDEVIKAYEICLNINETSCRDCPYTEFNAEGKWACSLCGDCIEDALHYLKKYREDKNNATTRYLREEEPDDYKSLWRFKELWE